MLRFLYKFLKFKIKSFSFQNGISKELSFWGHYFSTLGVHLGAGHY